MPIVKRPFVPKGRDFHHIPIEHRAYRLLPLVPCVPLSTAPSMATLPPSCRCAEYRRAAVGPDSPRTFTSLSGPVALMTIFRHRAPGRPEREAQGVARYCRHRSPPDAVPDGTRFAAGQTNVAAFRAPTHRTWGRAGGGNFDLGINRDRARRVDADRSAISERVGPVQRNNAGRRRGYLHRGE